MVYADPSGAVFVAEVEVMTLRPKAREAASLFVEVTLLPAFPRRRVPVVVPASRNTPLPEVVSIRAINWAGIKAAIEHLLVLGHPTRFGPGVDGYWGGHALGAS
ncbi:hypothetical protein QFZ33_002244 [Arthrobacter globiformis]|nr:hypothetical protein [Arthrobacter globiformis]